MNIEEKNWKFEFQRSDQIRAASLAGSAIYSSSGSILFMVAPFVLFLIVAAAIGASALLISYVLIKADLVSDFVTAMIANWIPFFSLLGGWVALVTLWPRLCIKLSTKLMKVPNRDGSPVEFSINDKGLIWSGDEFRTEVPWNAVDRLIDGDSSLTVLFGISVLHIPTSVFEDNVARTDFLNLCAARMSPDARKKSAL